MKSLYKTKYVVMLAWFLMVLSALSFNAREQYTHSIDVAKGIAKTTFNKNQAFGRWGSSHNGVYVPIDMPRTPPSPYLSHMIDRDITTPSGKKLTLMNPAYMLRQMIEEYTDLYGTHGHITALEILNPVSVADAWEREALLRFRKNENVKEVSELVDVNGEETLRFMRPMKVSAGCLNCHGHQETYKNTKTAGGVSVSVPMNKIYRETIESFETTLYAYLILFLLGLIFIHIVYKKEEKTKEKLQFLANHDALTGLPNRQGYKEKIHSLLEDKKVENIYLLFMDLDNFKTINDSLGHSVGDLLLQAVAKRIEFRMQKFDVFARFGGDEFVLLFSNVEDVSMIKSIAKRIHAIFEEAFVLGGDEVYTSASVGIAHFPDDATNTEDLLKYADVAMYDAKHSGKSQSSFYNKSMIESSKNKLLLDGELHKALDNDELFLLYQPQICLKDERLVGVEALIRWNSPTLGLISPVEFIPIAEGNGMIIPIGEWIIDTACKQLSLWKDTKMSSVSISINISAKQLLHQDLYKYIQKAIVDFKIDASLLELEITESVIMENISEAIGTLAKLKVLGLSIAIDDFGTGYSSLSYLKKLPIDKLKIDREFVKDIDTDLDDIAITKTIVSLAKSLGLKVIAEGPELQEHINLLKELRCEIAQGYFYSKPITPQECESF